MSKVITEPDLLRAMNGVEAEIENLKRIIVNGGVGGGDEDPVVADKSYEHVQNSAATIWLVTHGLGKYPAVTVLDSAGTEFRVGIEHLDLNTVRITWAKPSSGKAIFN